MNTDLYAQKNENSTTINACAKGAENRTARLFLEDAITKFQWKIDEQPIDENGCFQFNVNLAQTQRAFIKIDFYQTYIYVEQERSYNIIFDSFDFRIDEKINPFKLDQFLSYHFAEQDSNELNQLIWRFENMYDYFLVNHYADGAFGGVSKDRYENFKAQINQTFSYSGHGYFNDYKRYALADMERIFNFTSSKNLFLTHIENKPILYGNTAFADFITEYYADYFPFQIKYNRNVFVDQINDANDLSGIMDSLGRDTMLQNEKLRELVFLLGLQKMYHNSEFSNIAVLRLLLDVESTTKFSEHQALAKFIIQTLTRYESGVNRAFPNFREPIKNEIFDFSDTTKFKYVLFINSLCESCDAEIRTLQHIAGNLRDTVDFIVVNCDYEVNRAMRNKPKNLQHITYLHFNKDFETLEKLGVLDYPLAIWLDRKNVIQSYHFLLPSQRLERSIRHLIAEPK